MWPGRARSVGWVFGSIAARMVARAIGGGDAGRARRVLGVDRDAERRLEAGRVVRRPSAGCSSSSRRSSVIGRQIRPRPCLAMKLMTSGVTFSAAMVRSPSFSRSSSSTTMIIRPSRKASTAASMGEKGDRTLDFFFKSSFFRLPSSVCPSSVFRLPSSVFRLTSSRRPSRAIRTSRSSRTRG